MKLSSKARYGLKAMLYLAEHTELTSLGTLAEATEMSEAYLEQLFSLLKKSGLVTSVRGANGGYTLSKPPEQISVGEIVRTLEGELEIVDCINGECSNKCTCSSHKVWQIMYNAINDALDAITLESVIRGDI